MESLRPLIKDVFSLPHGQQLLKEWREQYCAKVFSSDPQRLIRNATISDFINDIDRIVNHD